jgi:hypothetical protein
MLKPSTSTSSLRPSRLRHRVVFALFVIAIAAAEVGVGRDRPAHLPQPQERRPRRPVGDEGLTMLESAWIIPLIPAAPSSDPAPGEALPHKGSRSGSRRGRRSCSRSSPGPVIQPCRRGVQKPSEGARLRPWPLRLAGGHGAEAVVQPVVNTSRGGEREVEFGNTPGQAGRDDARRHPHSLLSTCTGRPYLPAASVHTAARCSLFLRRCSCSS